MESKLTEHSNLTLQSSRLCSFSISPLLALLFRITSIILPMVISAKPLQLQSLYGLSPYIFFSLSLISSVFFSIAITEYNRLMYKVLKYEKAFSIFISGTFGYLSEISWILANCSAESSDLLISRSLLLYFINFAMFAFTSLILLIEYKNSAYPRSRSKVVKIKSGLVICIFIEILLYFVLTITESDEGLLDFIMQYVICLSNLAYLLTIYFDLNYTTFSEMKEQEYENLYISTL